MERRREEKMKILYKYAIKGLIACLVQIVKDLNSTIVYEKT